jgi:signal transduction histidine kinase/PAS domain-containing protein
MRRDAQRVAPFAARLYQWKGFALTSGGLPHTLSGMAVCPALAIGGLVERRSLVAGDAKTRRRPTDGAVVAEAGREATRARRGGLRSRGRESGVIGLVERARLTPSLLGMGLLLDPLLSEMPTMRSALLNRSLDDALRIAGGRLAASLAPSVLQVWIAEPAVWSGPHEQIGGLELFPTLRLRVRVSAAPSAALLATDGAPETPGPDDVPAGVTVSREPAATDPLIEEIAATRRPLVLFTDEERTIAADWFNRLPAMEASGEEAAQGPGTLLALPLRARGQFLGVVALATRQRLAQRQVTALEELSDLLALAADRDRLLSYSRTQEALAQTMVRHAPVAMALLTGSDHVVALANPTFFDLLGVEDSTQALGYPLHMVISDRAARFSTMLRLDAVYHGSQPQAMIELPIHLGRGITYWNVTTSPVVGEGGANGGVLVAAVDVTRQVTARQRAQDAAEITQERIEQMLALHKTTLETARQVGGDPRDLLASILRRSISLLSAQAGVIYARRSGDELDVVVSEGLRRDYTGSVIRVGEGLAGQVALSGQGRVIDDYRAYPAHSAIYDDEAVTAIISVPLAHHGQVVGVLDVLDDAERRTFTDDNLWLLELFAAQAAQAMENARMYVELESAYRKQRELDGMKDDFIATASHELRTPLTVVQGYLELLHEAPIIRGDSLASEFVTMAADSAEDLADVAMRLLQTSRLDTGRLELRLAPVRLAQVIEESLRSFRALQAAQGKTHELTMEAPDDLFALADPGRLKETLKNLISNAIKYSPNGGRVCVRCSPAAFPAALATEQAGMGAAPDAATQDDDPCAPLPAVVEAARTQPYHLILVSDDGMGIPAGERPQLFGRFSRLDSARESQIRGVGLGLYICRQTLRAMGGDIWLSESEPGKGSVFAFALPAAAPAAAPATGDA